MDVLRTLVSAQLPVTIFLAVLLWSLHARHRRPEFNRWWASAWTLYALFLAGGRLALTFPTAWSMGKGFIVLLTTLLGFLVGPALVFGAASLRSPGSVTRLRSLAGISGALVLGALSFAASIAWTTDPLTSFAVRHVGRTFGLAVALFFCAWVFFRRVRETKSSAAWVTGICCLADGVNQSAYTGAMLLHLFGTATGVLGEVGSAMLLRSARLVYVDVALTCGICLGMVLLLVEEYQRSERALTESVTRRREVSEENTALQLEIRARQEIERQLRASEDRYRDLVEHSEDLLVTHDLHGRVLSCNSATVRALGYDVNELLTMSVREMLAPEVRDQFDEYLTVIQRDGVATGIMRVTTQQGERRLWSYHNTLRTDGVASPIVRAMGRDVTEQLRAERALRLSEEKFAVAFRSSPSAKAIISAADDRFLDVNHAFAAQTGYARAELVNRVWPDMGMWFEPGDRAALRDALSENRRLHAREMRVRHRDGSVATVVFSTEVVHVGGERCVLLAGLDVTARKEVEARHQAILRALPDWVFLLTPDGVFLECHARDQRHLVMPPSDFIGRHIMDVLPPDLATRLLGSFREVLRSDQVATLEYTLPIGEETRFYEVRTVRSDGGQVLSLVRDVTDQKRAELRARDLQDELTHAARVMSLGTLTGSLAHEINQPLTAIRSNAYAALRLLEAETPDVGEVRDALSDIATDNQRIDDVLSRLRGLLRKERREYALVDVNAIVNDVLALAHSHFIEHRISVDVELGADVPAVLGDRVQLQQVVLNVLMNAVDAIRAGGPGDDRRVTVTTATTGSQVSVSITDRGAGASTGEFEQMFTPFYTTKPEGMGLGLSICRTIMDAHGGRISARRNPDRGLTCWFVVDAADPSPSVIAPHSFAMAGEAGAQA